MRSLALQSARLLVVALVILAAAACGGAVAGEPTSPPAGSPSASAPAGNVVGIVADGLRFTETNVTAPANAPFEIAFQNRDGVPHNVAVYRDGSASEKISVGEIFGGPATKVQEVPALPPGDYFFRCDVHPDMVGTLVVR